MVNGDEIPSEALLQHARSGDVLSMRLLGERMLVGRAAPYEPARGAGLVRMAAERGDLDALAFMSVLAALGVGQVSNWPEAIAYLRRAADRGHAGAQAQLDVLEGAAELEALLHAPAACSALNAPRVAVIEGFLSAAVCDWLIRRATPALSRARVHDPRDGGRRELDLRSNTGMGFSFLDTDFVLQLIHARIAAVMQLPVLHQEPTNVLHYRVGERYEPHFDFLNPEEPRFAAQIASVGQRVATFLVYLNDDFTGGETEFCEVNWRYKGKRGDALCFYNVTATGAPDPKTLHAGLPPTHGEKWLLSKWIRDRPIRLV